MMISTVVAAFASMCAAVVTVINAWKSMNANTVSAATLAAIRRAISDARQDISANTVITKTAAVAAHNAAIKADVAVDHAIGLGEQLKSSTEEIKVSLVKCVEAHAGIAEAIKAVATSTK
jgi:hypothetical protein